MWRGWNLSSLLNLLDLPNYLNTICTSHTRIDPSCLVFGVWILWLEARTPPSYQGPLSEWGKAGKNIMNPSLSLVSHPLMRDFLSLFDVGGPTWIIEAYGFKVIDYMFLVTDYHVTKLHTLRCNANNLWVLLNCPRLIYQCSTLFLLIYFRSDELQRLCFIVVDIQMTK